MASRRPVIPVTEGVDWYQYDTTDFGGWPTPDDPYAQPRGLGTARTTASC